VTTRRESPRVLLSAYQCGPGLGSVSQIGWEWYSRLARRLPVTLVTHVRNREALGKAGAPLPGSEVVFVDTEWFAGPLYRTAKRIFPRSEHAVFLVSSLDFFVYDRDAAKLLRSRGASSWDVVHCPTPVTTAAPTRLSRLGLPVVLGPLNSGLGLPEGFRSVMRADAGWLYPVRHFARIVDALVGSTRRAAAILVATKSTLSAVPARYRERCVQMLENGVELSRFTAVPWPEPPGEGRPLRVLFVGRLVPFKCVDYLLEAVSRVKGVVPVELRVVGDGPMATEWKSLADSLGLSSNVTFTGARSLDEVSAEMRDCHVFVLPSVRESGGGVLLEAMASARPVAGVAFGGPAEIVDGAVGCSLPADGPESLVAALAQLLRDVVADPEGWRRRGEEGRRRAESRFSWDAKVDEAVRLYERILGKKADS
jgi:glycosyltransferase involved in cell wall biosynthesis